MRKAEGSTKEKGSGNKVPRHPPDRDQLSYPRRAEVTALGGTAASPPRLRTCRRSGRERAVLEAVGVEPRFHLTGHGEWVTAERGGPNFDRRKRKPEMREETARSLCKSRGVWAEGRNSQGSEKHRDLLSV